MKRNVNAVVQVDVTNLHRPLTSWQAKQLCSFAAEFRGVPSDISAVAVVIYKPNGDHFVALPCSQDSNGDWIAECLPSHFPNNGNAKYEVIGTDSNERTCAFGEGKIVIDAFGSGTIPVPSEDPVPLIEIPDQYGVAHRIRAVNVGTAENPDWTSQVEV